MTRTLPLICLGLTLLVSTRAVATVDTGAYATLVALLGEAERYAVFTLNDLNEGLLLRCRDITIVDLEADIWRERRLAEASESFEPPPNVTGKIPEDDGPRLKLIRAALSACLGAHAPELAELPMRLITRDAVRPLSALPAAPTASLERVYEGPVTALSFPCDGNRDKRCPTPCLGRESVERLVLTDRSSGARSHGTTLVIAPTSLVQVFMGCETYPDDPPRSPELVDTSLELAELALVETERAFIVFGGVAHAPMANGTHLPVAAALRKDGRAFTPPPGPYASPRGCACQGGQGEGALPEAALTLLVLVALRTRNRVGLQGR